MSYDRKAYREYIKSDPFKGVEGRANGHESGGAGAEPDGNGDGVVTTLPSGTEAGTRGEETDRNPWGR